MANKTVRNVEEMEETVLEQMLERIEQAQDPVDQYKAVERYHAFIKARGDRLESERDYAR
jgi:hypothetical protein